MSNTIKIKKLDHPEATAEQDGPRDVVIGWVHPGDVTNAFMDSLLRSIGFDLAPERRRIAGWNGVQCSANVSTGRNALVEWFLSSSAEWLMMIDTDMVWAPDAIHRLLEAADPVAAPVVGGLCFAQEADTGRIWPTLYTLVEGTEPGAVEFARFDTWPQDTLFPVVGTGAAFLLMHRGALERVREREFSTVYPWFQERELYGRKVGEDVTLCMRLAQCDVPVSVHTGVHIGHIKRHVVTFEAYVAQMEMLAESASLLVPAATVTLDGDDD